MNEGQDSHVVRIGNTELVINNIKMTYLGTRDVEFSYARGGLLGLCKFPGKECIDPGWGAEGAVTIIGPKNDLKEYKAIICYGPNIRIEELRSPYEAHITIPNTELRNLNRAKYKNISKEIK